ncbi:MAG: hypothetical protein H0W08_15830 [Acidobacteria bacterium]|nr:hypothetical protein [Acidobacteriota bacterium]
MIAAVLDTLSIDAVDVVANDSGGAVAQLLAARHPARVRTLLLTNCDSHTNSPPKSLAEAHGGLSGRDGAKLEATHAALARSVQFSARRDHPVKTVTARHQTAWPTGAFGRTAIS